MGIKLNPLIFSGLDIASDGGSSSISIGSSITGATSGSVLFVGSGNVLQQDNTNLFWDNTNKRLGIGEDSPTQALEVNGNILSTQLRYGNSSEFISISQGSETLIPTIPSLNTTISFNNTSGNERGIIVNYRIIETTTNNIRIGTLLMVSNGTTTSITDNYIETSPTGVVFNLLNSGAITNLQYNKTGTNNANFKYTITRF